MIWTLATWAVLAGSLLAIFYMFVTALVHFPGRTVDDVAEFLRPVDLERVQLLLDPAMDFELTWKLDPETLREVRRKRIQVYLELLGRMAHNARVLVEFGNREASRLEVCGTEEQATPEAKAIAALQVAAVNVRIYSVFAIVLLRVLLAIRPIQAPSLVGFRSLAELDGIESYEALREATTVVFEKFRRPTDKLILNF